MALRPVTEVTPLPATPFQRHMAAGHYNRLGHALDARHVTADGELWHTVRLCCGEEMPEEVLTL